MLHPRKLTLAMPGRRITTPIGRSDISFVTRGGIFRLGIEAAVENASSVIERVIRFRLVVWEVYFTSIEVALFCDRSHDIWERIK